MAEFAYIDVPRWPQTVRIEVERLTLDDGDASPLEWMTDTPEEDGARIQDWRDGRWTLIGIRARALIFVPIGGSSFAQYELTSPGIWGIESDSDEDYLEDTYQEEVTQLLDAMRQMGFAATLTEALRTI